MKDEALRRFEEGIVAVARAAAVISKRDIVQGNPRVGTLRFIAGARYHSPPVRSSDETLVTLQGTDGRPLEWFELWRYRTGNVEVWLVQVNHGRSLRTHVLSA